MRRPGSATKIGCPPTGELGCLLQHGVKEPFDRVCGHLPTGPPEDVVAAVDGPGQSQVEMGHTSTEQPAREELAVEWGHELVAQAVGEMRQPALGTLGVEELVGLVRTLINRGATKFCKPNWFGLWLRIWLGFLP